VSLDLLGAIGWTLVVVGATFMLTVLIARWWVSRG